MSDDTTALAAAPKGGIIPNEAGFIIDASDIDIPRLNIVQKTSDIDAPFGSVVLDKKHIMLAPEAATEVSVLAATKGWREDVPFEDDVMPQIAYTEADRARIAESSEYNLLEFAEITLLFQQPEDSENDSAYPFTIGKLSYALGKINVAKDAYRQTFKRLATYAAFNRDKNLGEVLWNFESCPITRGKYSWFAPMLTVSQNTPDKAVTAWIRDFNGN
tara:strand:- start:5857 stop:6507 length:651 start_codon:yes stop_codon:yes gene_type:complete